MWIVYVLAGIGLFIMFGGVLAVLAISGVRKYIANAKSAEARNSVGVIGRDAVAAYEAGAPRRLCPSASRSVPDSVLKVSGKKYLSTPGEWEIDKTANAGFACLKFSMTSPQYYSYSYRAKGASAPGDGFEAIANGDLAGNGVISHFKLTGQIGAGGTLDLAPRLIEETPDGRYTE